MEESSTEWKWILTKMGLDEIINIDGKYKNRRSAERFRKMPENVAQTIYRRFFTDFVSFGYSPEFVASFVQSL